MEWLELNSSNISAIGYDPLKRELGLRFVDSGKTYVYVDVPREEYEAFVMADSKGTYLNEVFKAKGCRYKISGR